MIKTNIKMRVNQEQSESIQKICIDNKIFWSDKTCKDKIRETFTCLFITDCISHSRYNLTFELKEYEEVDADLFIKTNGSCNLISSKSDALTDVTLHFNNKNLGIHETDLPTFILDPNKIDSYILSECSSIKISEVPIHLELTVLRFLDKKIGYLLNKLEADKELETLSFTYSMWKTALSHVSNIEITGEEDE